MTNETATVDSLTDTIHNGVNRIVAADKPFEKLDKAKELHSYLSNEGADFEETKGLLEFMVNLNKYINFMTFANSVYSSLKADSRAMFRLETIQQSYLLTNQDVPLSEESEMLMDDSQRMINRFRDNSVFENNKPIASTILTFLERKGDLSLKPMGKYLAYQLKDKMAKIAPVPKVKRVENDDGEWEYPSLTDEQKEGLKQNSELLKELKDVLYKQISDVVKKMIAKRKTYSPEEREKARKLFKDGFYGLARELKIDDGLSDEVDANKKARQKELYDKIGEEIESAFSTLKSMFPGEIDTIKENPYDNLDYSIILQKIDDLKDKIRITKGRGKYIKDSRPLSKAVAMILNLDKRIKKANDNGEDTAEMENELRKLMARHNRLMSIPNLKSMEKNLEYLEQARDKKHAEKNAGKLWDRNSNLSSIPNPSKGGGEYADDPKKVKGGWTKPYFDFLTHKMKVDSDWLTKGGRSIGRTYLVQEPKADTADKEDKKPKATSYQFANEPANPAESPYVKKIVKNYYVEKYPYLRKLAQEGQWKDFWETVESIVRAEDGSIFRTEAFPYKGRNSQDSVDGKQKASKKGKGDKNSNNPAPVKTVYGKVGKIDDSAMTRNRHGIDILNQIRKEREKSESIAEKILKSIQALI